MSELLGELEEILTDLLQSGFATGGPAACPRLRDLARRYEEAGLHTGAALARELETALDARPHTLQKEDLPLAAILCRIVRYLELCREKAQEDAIARRWHHQDPSEQGGNV